MGAFRVLSVAHNTVERGRCSRVESAGGRGPASGRHLAAANLPQASIRYELQHAGLPCPPLFPPVCSDSSPLSRWCRPQQSIRDWRGERRPASP